MDIQVDFQGTAPEIYTCSRCHPVRTEDVFIATTELNSLVIWSDSIQEEEQADKSDFCQCFPLEVNARRWQTMVATIVYHSPNSAAEIVQITAHAKPILSMCVSSSSQPYLCTCSVDKIIIWRYNELALGESTSGMLVGVDLGVVNNCALSSDNKWLALCRENDIWVVQLEHDENGVLSAVSHSTTLDLFTTMCCFSPIHTDLLVTADDSNSFKVWCAASGRVVHRVAVGCWQRISLCEFVLGGRLQGHLLVGTNRGELHLFAVNPCRPPRDLGHVLAAPSSYCRTTGGQGESCEAGFVILSALLLDRDPSASLVDEEADDFSSEQGVLGCAEQEDPTIRGILAPGTLLFVCSNLGVGVYDCNSWDCYGFHPYTELLDQALIAGAALVGRAPGRLRCLLSCLGWGRAGVTEGCRALGWGVLTITCTPKGVEESSSGLSFLGMSATSARSPLRAQFSRPAVDPVRATFGPKGKPSASVQQRAVKSSGYGITAPKAQRFTPNTNRPVLARSGFQLSTRPQRPSGAADDGLLARLNGNLMRSWTPPLQQRNKLSIWPDFGTTVRLASSGDGASLACSSGPGVLSVLQWARPSMDECARISGHDARVTSLAFSTDGSWLVSGATDGSTKVWDWRVRRCVLDIPDATSWSASTSDKRTAAASMHSQVSQAAFYYMDKFVLRAIGSTLELYCHRLHENGGTVKQWLGAHGWRRVRKIQFPAQQVSCFIAPNTFYSNLVVGGCSSRSLHVYDMDSERFLLELRDAHSRAPHCLTSATPSSAASQSPASADLFLSTAICDGIKLWDLRQARCVQKYMRHLNRAHACGVALSPCCRYLAAGSEDKCVYIYDTRNSRDNVDKLFGLNEVVVDVVWNSCRPLLGASALNNSVAVYGEKASS